MARAKNTAIKPIASVKSSNPAVRVANRAKASATRSTGIAKGIAKPSVAPTRPSAGTSSLAKKKISSSGKGMVTKKPITRSTGNMQKTMTPRGMQMPTTPSQAIRNGGNLKKKRTY
jgi:hypothetical protein